MILQSTPYFIIPSFMPYPGGLTLATLSNLTQPQTSCSYTLLSALCLQSLTLGISTLHHLFAHSEICLPSALWADFSNLKPHSSLWPSASLPGVLILVVFYRSGFCVSILQTHPNCMNPSFTSYPCGLSSPLFVPSYYSLPSFCKY